jgi:UDP-hydrolysing UDP-N-acetyl-D-glucosamine 2-epimerase
MKANQSVRRRVCVFTGTRAEYGLLYWLMKEIQADERLELQVVVSGAHLSPVHGDTWRQVQADGFPISARVDMLLSSDGSNAVTKSMGLGLIGMADAFERLAPDLLVVLGDRYEAMVAAQAAMMARVPIAHLHGGESTEGAVDEAIRHAITKMSHLHFVAAEAFRQRVIQLGEQPARVWTVGATGLDNIERLSWLSREELEADLGIPLAAPLFLVTYHPVTLGDDGGAAAMRSLLEALDEFGGTVVITGANADAGASALRREAHQYAQARGARVLLAETLGARRYLSLMRCADAVVGNSSSGLLEAPAVGTPAVDIGARQAGRPRAPAVIHCGESRAEIAQALRAALSDECKAVARKRDTPYGRPGAARRICEVLATQPLEGILHKRFFDLGQQAGDDHGRDHCRDIK